MRIIREGILPEEYVACPTCLHCNCHFECTRNEGKYISDQRDGDCIQFDCPTCKRYVYVDTKQFKPKEKKKPLPPPPIIDQLVILAEQDPRNK